MLDTARRKDPQLQWVCADLASLDLDERFDVVVMAGNVMIFVEPGTEAQVVARMAAHLVPGGRLVAGFQLGQTLGLEAYDAVGGGGRARARSPLRHVGRRPVHRRRPLRGVGAPPGRVPVTLRLGGPPRRLGRSAHVAGRSCRQRQGERTCPLVGAGGVWRCSSASASASAPWPSPATTAVTRSTSRSWPTRSGLPAEHRANAVSVPRRLASVSQRDLRRRPSLRAHRDRQGRAAGVRRHPRAATTSARGAGVRQRELGLRRRRADVRARRRTRRRCARPRIQPSPTTCRWPKS